MSTVKDNVSQIGSPEMQQLYSEGCKYLTPPHTRLSINLALDSFERSMAIQPFKEGYLNIGNCHSLLGNFELAYKNYLMADDPNTGFLLTLENGQWAEPYNNLGALCYSVQKDDEALEWYNKSLKVNPSIEDSLSGKSFCLLRKACSGQTELFDEGWEQYEYRFLKFPPIKGKPNIVPWDGKPRDELIIMVEQGYGDTFMFARYIPHVKEIVKKVWIQCEDPKLFPIFERFGVDMIKHVKESPCNTVISMGSLPRFFSGIPNGDWLRGWGETHEFPKDQFNIGVVYSGYSRNPNNHNRSTDVANFRRLAKYGTLYSLTPGVRKNDYINTLPLDKWEDTVSYINGLDLVISVDTSVVHLCGILGKECWMLNPLRTTDFRWGDDSVGEDNMWYESVRVFRNPSDWSVVFDNVEKALKEYTSNR